MFHLTKVPVKQNPMYTSRLLVLCLVFCRVVDCQVSANWNIQNNAKILNISMFKITLLLFGHFFLLFGKSY